MKLKESSFDRVSIYNAKVLSGDEASRIYTIADDSKTFISKLENENVPYVVVTTNTDEARKFINDYGMEKVLNVIPSDGKFGVKTIFVKKPDVSLSTVESILVNIANNYLY